MCRQKLDTPWSIYRDFMVLDFLKLNPHCALFILQQALYNSHSKKNISIFTKFVCKALCLVSFYFFVCQFTKSV